MIADNTLVAGTTAVNMTLQVTADLLDGNPVAALGAVSQGIVGSNVQNAGGAACVYCSAQCRERCRDLVADGHDGDRCHVGTFGSVAFVFDRGGKYGSGYFRFFRQSQ